MTGVSDEELRALAKVDVQAAKAIVEAERTASSLSDLCPPAPVDAAPSCDRAPVADGNPIPVAPLLVGAGNTAPGGGGEPGNLFTAPRIDRPVAGFYRMRLRSGAPPVGIRIWHGQPLEPWTRETMDRAPCWNAECNGRWIDFDRVWPQCAGEPITEDEYRYLSERHRWAVENDPNDAFATPRERVDWLNSSPAI